MHLISDHLFVKLRDIVEGPPISVVPSDQRLPTVRIQSYMV